MKLNIHNTTGYKISKELISMIKRSIKKTLELSNKNFDELNIIFVDNKEIKKINRKFLKKNRTTDVIAFNFPKTTPLNISEVYICVDKAIENSRIYKIPFEVEVLILVIHGVLHVSGYDDGTKLLRKKMNNLTLKILKSI